MVTGVRNLLTEWNMMFGVELRLNEVFRLPLGYDKRLGGLEKGGILPFCGGVVWGIFAGEAA